MLIFSRESRHFDLGHVSLYISFDLGETCNSSNNQLALQFRK